MIAGILSLVFCASCMATNEVASLPTVVVEATRLGQTKIETASHVDVITADEIAGSGANSTVELLEKCANVFLRTLDNPIVSQVSMRGYGANGFGRVKILVDGEELNNPDMCAQNLMNVPLASIGRIEVLHGPQTVLNGGDASAGVINIVTDLDSYEGKSVFEVRGGSFGRFGAHAGTRGGIENDGLTYYADFDFDRSDGWRENSWYELWTGKGGLKQRFDNGAWAALKVFYSNSQYGLPGGIYSSAVDDGWHDRARDADDGSSHARNDIYGINVSAEGVVDADNRLFGEFAFRNRQSRSYGYLDYDIYTFTYKAKYENRTRFFGMENQADAGIDAKHDIILADSINPEYLSGGKNDYWRFTGELFARDELFIVDELSLFGGVRGAFLSSRDRYRTWSAIASDSARQGEIAGEAGVNWRPVEDAKIFARWTRFYHAPLADELFSAYGVPNLSLKPESGNNFEIGMDWTVDKEFNFNLTGYHTELDDEIMYMYGGNRNSPSHTARDGFETSLGWSRKRVGSAVVMYSFVHSRFTEDELKGDMVPMSPMQWLTMHGECFIVDWLAVNGGFRFVGSQYCGGDFENEGDRLPAYCLFDVGIRFVPTWSWLDGFTLAVTVDNLFDERYCSYGEYFGTYYLYPANARSFLVTIRYEF